MYFYIYVSKFKSIVYLYEIWCHIYTIVTIAVVCQDIHVCLFYFCVYLEMIQRIVSSFVVNTEDKCSSNP